MRFLGGWYAFPGGKVDPGDAAPMAAARVRGVSAEDASRCFTADDGTPPLAYWVAAARELLEETGVLLACDARGRSLGAGDVDAISACRRDVMDGAAFADALARHDWYCDLASLRYLSYFVTPTRSPLRFTARFFLCPVPAGQSPRLFAEETSEGFWIAPGEAYRRFVDEEMAMAEPAEYAVGYLSQFGSLGELWQAHADGRARFEGITHRSEAYYADAAWKAARFPDRARRRA
jgi:8-oxo-dGTP pyrophosphatase MutT (NUDIX family)